MNILFVWTGVTSYMSDCWRALASKPSVSLKIVIEERRSACGTAFDVSQVLRRLDVAVLYENMPVDIERWRCEVRKFKPDVMFIVGWRAKTCRFFAEDLSFAAIPKVVIFDLPFQFSFRKLLAPIVLHRYLRRFKMAYVPGIRAVRYAKWLGFRDANIKRGLFSCAKPSPALDTARKRQFLYVGRYSREKRLDILGAAYAKYRELAFCHGEEPWDLVCCGKGDASEIRGKQKGVVVHEFLQPDEVRKLYAASGALVIASDFDPWPLVILEAVSACMPVICTDACGDSEELVRDNGFVVRTGDANALADAMLRMTLLSDTARECMGVSGLRLAAPYSAEAWADRTLGICMEVTK